MIFQIGTVVLGPFVPVLVVATTLILILAANTAFNGLPIACGDSGRRWLFAAPVDVSRHAPGVFDRHHCACDSGRRIDHVFNARTTALIPLYAIGVFMSFSLSQWGMVVHWLRASKLKPGEESRTSVYGHLQHDPDWRVKLIINLVGGTISVLVMLIFAVTKFSSGAWITVILIPAPGLPVFARATVTINMWRAF